MLHFIEEHRWNMMTWPWSFTQASFHFFLFDGHQDVAVCCWRPDLKLSSRLTATHTLSLLLIRSCSLIFTRSHPCLLSAPRITPNMQSEKHRHPHHLHFILYPMSICSSFHSEPNSPHHSKTLCVDSAGWCNRVRSEIWWCFDDF